MKEDLDTLQMKDDFIVIIDDVRFKNEMEGLKAVAPCVFIKLTRDPLPPDSHPSEHGLDGVAKSAFDIVAPPDSSEIETLEWVWNRLKEIIYAAV